MKLDDYISQQILRFPSLYKDVDYEKSKHKVLCQAFFTIGNGLELPIKKLITEWIDPNELPQNKLSYLKHGKENNT